jgi:hypothetical protein
MSNQRNGRTAVTDTGGANSWHLSLFGLDQEDDTASINIWLDATGDRHNSEEQTGTLLGGQ